MGKQKIQSRFVWKGGLFCCELMCDVCVLRVSFILLSFMYLFFVTVFFNDCFVCSVWSGAWLDSLVQSTTYHYRHYSWPISRPPRCIKKQNFLGSCIFNFFSLTRYSLHFSYKGLKENLWNCNTKCIFKCEFRKTYAPLWHMFVIMFFSIAFEIL